MFGGAPPTFDSGSFMYTGKKYFYLSPQNKLKTYKATIFGFTGSESSVYYSEEVEPGKSVSNSPLVFPKSCQIVP